MPRHVRSRKLRHPFAQDHGDFNEPHPRIRLGFEHAHQAPAVVNGPWREPDDLPGPHREQEAAQRGCGSWPRFGQAYVHEAASLVDRELGLAFLALAHALDLREGIGLERTLGDEPFAHRPRLQERMPVGIDRVQLARPRTLAFAHFIVEALARDRVQLR